MNKTCAIVIAIKLFAIASLNAIRSSHPHEFRHLWTEPRKLLLMNPIRSITTTYTHTHANRKSIPTRKWKLTDGFCLVHTQTFRINFNWCCEQSSYAKAKTIDAQFDSIVLPIIICVCSVYTPHWMGEQPLLRLAFYVCILQRSGLLRAWSHSFTSSPLSTLSQAHNKTVESNAHFMCE